MIADIARHAEPNQNIPYADNPGLSDRGRFQAEKLGLVFAGQDIEVVLASPIERAKETGEIVASTLGLNLEVDDRLKEIRYSPDPYGRSLSFWAERLKSPKRALIIAHCGIIRHLIVAGFGGPAKDRYKIGKLVDYASISTVNLSTGQLTRYGDTEHLT